MRREMNGVTKSRFEMFSNNDEAVINKKLPKELLLRIFSFLDVVTLCRCAQVSRHEPHEIFVVSKAPNRPLEAEAVGPATLAMVLSWTLYLGSFQRTQHPMHPAEELLWLLLAGAGTEGVCRMAASALGSDHSRDPLAHHRGVLCTLRPVSPVQMPGAGSPLGLTRVLASFTLTLALLASSGDAGLATEGLRSQPGLKMLQRRPTLQLRSRTRRLQLRWAQKWGHHSPAPQGTWKSLLGKGPPQQATLAWNVLALDGSNWQRIDLFDFQRDIEGRVVENISKRCGGFLRKLSLRGCLGVGDNALRTFAQNCRNIEVLNLNGCTKITDTTCTSLSKFCSKLRHLDLASCTSITNLSLKALSEGCPLLEQLNISWCDQVTKDGIQALVRGCGGLKALFLKGCTQLEDEALKYIGAHCPELVTLNLQTCLQITDDGLITICRGCHKLQSLCASGCSNITDAILNALGQNCPRLRILEVARCSQLTDVGFTTLARNCHELEKMDLEECVQITDSTLIQLSIHCPRLQVLSLSHCELITDDGIRHLGNGACAHDRLEVIELDNCPLITDASLEHLKSCHSLERIELYDCQQITRAGIKRLRTHLPNIKVHAYFAPVTPPPSVGGSRQRFCRCCIIL
ncbi:F-box/LRR-repeat protein 20 isoform X1 [Apus apus]|uniref:F-box/LRR-repeat protein 20 isoform X1 n=1 Tax=Apus apus TaxID=8895 RepID=UPI0021F8410A|nr:F-box/LRR-repeat protein 20 isoform X1 [Apus apus]